MEDNIINLDANPERERLIQITTERRDRLLDSAHFLKVITDVLRPGLASAEIHLPVDGSAAVSCFCELKHVDEKAVVGVKATIILTVKFEEFPLVQPVTNGLVVPGDTSPSSLLLPGQKLH